MPSYISALYAHLHILVSNEGVCMSIVNTVYMLKDAQKLQYAVGAFNVENMEMIQAVIAAAETQHAPVIVQTTPGTLKYASPATYLAMVTSLAKKSSVPIAMHLDHGNSYALVEECLVAGYSSVMFDGSSLPFEENIYQTAKVVEAANKFNIPVEAELGIISGKEDTLDIINDKYTDPTMAAEFVRRTGVSSLAVAIGTAHGIYSQNPILDVERLKAIRAKVDIPLVLHGASGLTIKQVQDCIATGICKINFATDLRIAYTQGVIEALENSPIDPKVYGRSGRTKVQMLVEKCMRECKASEKV